MPLSPKWCKYTSGLLPKQIALEISSEIRSVSLILFFQNMFSILVVTTKHITVIYGSGCHCSTQPGSFGKQTRAAVHWLCCLHRVIDHLVDNLHTAGRQHVDAFMSGYLKKICSVHEDKTRTHTQKHNSSCAGINQYTWLRKWKRAQRERERESWRTISLRDIPKNIHWW